MNKLAILLSILFPAILSAGPMLEIQTLDELNQYAQDGMFNGVLYVEKNGTQLFKKMSGVQDFVSLRPILFNDRFQMGSVTKQFTAAAILKLGEQGKLKLDDPINIYVQGFSNEIKIRDLLNHSAGLKNYTEVESFWKDVDYNVDLSLSDILNFIVKLNPDFEPRAKFSYSNSGYIVAGRIIEIVSGLPWHIYLRDHFFVPLKMSNTGYSPKFESEYPVIGHMKGQDGALGAVRGFNMSWALTSGGLYSTAEDLAKWAAIYDDSQVLSERSKQAMQTVFLNNYALGIVVTKLGGETLLSHGGRTPGFVTNLSYLRESKLIVVSWDNVDGGEVDINSIALTYFKNGKAQAVKLKPFLVNEQSLVDYVGSYVNGKTELAITVNKGKLFLQPNDGQPAYELTANDVDSFRLRGISGEEFIRNDQGVVVSLNHYQGGKVTQFIKK